MSEDKIKIKASEETLRLEFGLTDNTLSKKIQIGAAFNDVPYRATLGDYNNGEPFCAEFPLLERDAYLLAFLIREALKEISISIAAQMHAALVDYLIESTSSINFGTQEVAVPVMT